MDTEPKKVMTQEEAITIARQQGAKQFNETMKQLLAIKEPSIINFEITALEEFAITCLAHHVFNHGIGAHSSTQTPFGTWNPSQAFVKEQEIVERILERSKVIKQQYFNKQGKLDAINPDFKDEVEKFNEAQNENTNIKQ